LYYESLKHSGQLRFVGVNFFENADAQAASARPAQVARANADEKHAQLDNLRAFQARSAQRCAPALEQLAHTARRGGDVFEALMQTVKFASLGQITHALFEVGGAYRRAM
jgi:methylmalonyl-CoA mutase